MKKHYFDTVSISGSNVVLTWPVNVGGLDFTGFTLLTATDLTSPVWTTNLSRFAILNGQYTLTNPIARSPQFFRLMR